MTSTQVPLYLKLPRSWVLSRSPGVAVWSLAGLGGQAGGGSNPVSSAMLLVPDSEVRASDTSTTEKYLLF